MFAIVQHNTLIRALIVRLLLVGVAVQAFNPRSYSAKTATCKSINRALNRVVDINISEEQRSAYIKLRRFS